MILFSMVLESKLLGGGGVLALLFAGLILCLVVCSFFFVFFLFVCLFALGVCVMGPEHMFLTFGVAS